MRQLLLDLPRGADYGAEAWLSTKGVKDAEEALARAQGCVALYGPEGCGKTHLLVMAAMRDASLLVVDELETLEPAAQELLFHEFNARKGGGMVVASRVPVAQMALLPDLKSRLLTGVQVEMRLPEDDELRELLARWAHARQLVLPGAVVDYLMVRADRNPKRLLALVAKLDALSLEEKRAVTVPLAKKVLERR